MNRRLAAVLLGGLLALVGASPAYAANEEPIEFKQIRPGPLAVYRLSYWGVGQFVNGDRCDGSDSVFGVNVPRHSSGRFRLDSNSSWVDWALNGASPMGYNLESGSSHICIGTRHTVAAGGPWNINGQTYIWIE